MTLSHMTALHEAISDLSYTVPECVVLECTPDTLVCQSIGPGDIDWFDPDGNI